VLSFFAGDIEVGLSKCWMALKARHVGLECIPKNGLDFLFVVFLQVGLKEQKLSKFA